MKKFDYEKIRLIRELQIEEIKEQIPVITIEVLRLVEMRVQTLIMAGLTSENTESEIKNEFKIK